MTTVLQLVNDLGIHLLRVSLARLESGEGGLAQSSVQGEEGGRRARNERGNLGPNTGRMIPRTLADAELVKKRFRLQGRDTREAGGREPRWLRAFSASHAQVKPLPSRPLTLPTLFRNRVPETGRAAGREARSVPVSFPFESPCGISFHTVRKSERETVGWSAAPGRLPH